MVELVAPIVDTCMHKMTSIWGAWVRGEPDVLESLKKKINGSVKRADDFFISMVGKEHILRCNRWDGAPNATLAWHLAFEDISLLDGCLDILEPVYPLDACARFLHSTVYFYMANFTQR